MGVRSNSELAAILRMAADEVERGASFEGRIAWTFAEDAEGNEVDVFIRNGNDMGQGGAWLIRPSDVTAPSQDTGRER